MAGVAGNQPLYICRNCKNPIALRSDLLSKAFIIGAKCSFSKIPFFRGKKGKSGPAYMFSHAMNIIAGQKEDRKLITGAYSVADIYCCNCGEILGWKYLRAYEMQQKSKEGKFIIETAKIAKEY
ncbi:protein yippee-like At4g27740 isoform X1 [Juglans regia]|uniref:Protein yippee-like n=1 Tax=Juglans regia TaxID=51240 RepID=A0A6P9EB64_JUGRE|nr:protein yippee-like At4g27740 isoform X1 [Juglans regia]